VTEGEGMTVAGSDPALGDPATPFQAAAEAPLADDRQVCPFLAAEGPNGSRLAAIGRPDPANQCMALGEAQSQSDRQQALVCLTASHVNCPRYLRGVLLAGTPPPKPARQPISAAVVGSALVLAAALAASFGFLIVRGGFDVPIASPGGSQLAISRPPSATPVSTIAPSPSPSASPSPSPTPSASPTPGPTPSPTVAPTRRPTPAPTSDRYAVLTRCPSTPNCWIYIIRAGDNLQSIANWFGVSLDKIRAMNPGLTTPIQPGDRLRIPTPTR
jgi:LysM repeat protein